MLARTELTLAARFWRLSRPGCARSSAPTRRSTSHIGCTQHGRAHGAVRTLVASSRQDEGRPAPETAAGPLVANSGRARRSRASREWSLREPCSSAEGGGGACSILANTDRPVRANRARGTTSAFVESDRRELPRAGERSGDDPALRRRRRQLTLCHVGTRPGSAVRTMALRGMRSCRGSKPDKSFRPVTSRARSCAMATFRYPAVRSVRFEGRDRFRVNPRGRPSRRCTAGSSESPQACIVRGSRRPCGCIRNILGDPGLTILRTGADLAGLARDRSSRRLISRARGAARYFPPTGRPSAGRSVRAR